jgi:hypothetical protein
MNSASYSMSGKIHHQSNAPGQVALQVVDCGAIHVQADHPAAGRCAVAQFSIVSQIWNSRHKGGGSYIEDIKEKAQISRRKVTA